MDETSFRERLHIIEDAEVRFLKTAAAFSEDDLRSPSLCDGWTRGHVLAHVALNAHSLVNLFEWARTGQERPQYASREQRAADIERYSTRTPEEHLGALSDASDAFFRAANAVPLERWTYLVGGNLGDRVPAEVYLFARNRELEVHHVDLDAGYRPEDWPATFVREALGEVPGRFDDWADGSIDATATDIDLRFTVGSGETTAHITGPGHALLFWFLRGRADGLGVDTELPALPSWG